MKLVQACLCVRKDLESSFHHCGSPVKLVQACLRARKSLEFSFHYCGGPVNLVQAWDVGERPDKAVLTAEEVLWSTCSPV